MSADSEGHGLRLKTVTSLAPHASKAGLLRELQAVRRTGYAADREEFEVGLTCVAVPLAVPEHDFCGAISISAPTLRMPEKNIRACSEKLRRTRDIMHRALLGQ